MSDEELRAIRELERRIEAVGSSRQGVLYEVAQLTKGMADSLKLHHQADERASKDIAQELMSLREGLATLVERSLQHDRTLRNHELVLGACALLMLAAKLAHWI